MMQVMFYIGSILLANIFVSKFGLVDMGFIVFPAGAVFIGLTFSLRDLVQQRYGKWKCWLWMILASVITLLFNMNLAIASVTAFIVSESVDWLIYTYSGGSFKKRLFLSNIFGVPLDSVIFVSLAFGFAWQPIIGQTIIKLLSSITILLLPPHMIDNKSLESNLET